MSYPAISKDLWTVRGDHVLHKIRNQNKLRWRNEEFAECFDVTPDAVRFIRDMATAVRVYVTETLEQEDGMTMTRIVGKAGHWMVEPCKVGVPILIKEKARAVGQKCERFCSDLERYVNPNKTKGLTTYQRNHIKQIRQNVGRAHELGVRDLEKTEKRRIASGKKVRSLKELNKLWAEV